MVIMTTRKQKDAGDRKFTSVSITRERLQKVRDKHAYAHVSQFVADAVDEKLAREGDEQ